MQIPLRIPRDLRLNPLIRCAQQRDRRADAERALLRRRCFADQQKRWQHNDQPTRRERSHSSTIPHVHVLENDRMALRNAILTVHLKPAPTHTSDPSRIVVIVPAKNESSNLAILFRRYRELNLPYQMVVIDGR